MKLSLKQKILLPFIIITLLFIFGNSAMPKLISATESEVINSILKGILQRIFGDFFDTVNLIRKLAHMLEFAVLGAQICLFVIKYKIKTSKLAIRLAMALNVTFILAFIDESIQILSNRGPQISDVWIDLAGAVLGIIFAALVYLLVYYFNEKHELRKQKNQEN